MTTRTDIHRPAEIKTEDYIFVGINFMKIEEVGDEIVLAEHRKAITAALNAGATWSEHSHGGSCHVCGAHAIYTAVFFHIPTNQLIQTGFDCADKIEKGHDNDFRKAKAEIKSARENFAGKQKARLLCEDHGIPQAFDIGTSDVHSLNQTKGTIIDMVRKLIKWGSLSDKQWAFLKSLVDRLGREDEIKAERAAEKEAASPCPDGKIELTVTVLSVKWHENQFGGDLKMFCREASGFTVWGTVPAKISDDLKKGDRVNFTATVTPAEDDPKHGFFKRPSKASIVRS